MGDEKVDSLVAEGADQDDQAQAGTEIKRSGAEVVIDGAIEGLVKRKAR